MLLCDKYSPKALSEHEDNTQRLFFQHAKEFPHLLVFGPEGSGKLCIVQNWLCEIYGRAAGQMQVINREFKSGSKSIDLPIFQSRYHFIINPSMYGLHDRNILRQFITEIGSGSNISLTYNSDKLSDDDKDIEKSLEEDITHQTDKTRTNDRMTDDGRSDINKVSLQNCLLGARYNLASGSGNRIKKVDPSGRKAENTPSYKIIVIKNAEELSEGAQHFLKNALETNTMTLRFILLSKKLARISPPVISRCLKVKICPTHNEMMKKIKSAIESEGIQMNEQRRDQLVRESLFSYRRLWNNLERVKWKQFNDSSKQAFGESCDRNGHIFEKIINLSDVDIIGSMPEIRNQLFSLMSVGYKPYSIVRSLSQVMAQSRKDCEKDDKQRDPKRNLDDLEHILKCACIADDGMMSGNKPIIHLEKMLIQYVLIKKHNRFIS